MAEFLVWQHHHQLHAALRRDIRGQIEKINDGTPRTDAALWITDGWSDERIIQLINLGVSYQSASHLWDSGIRDVDIIIDILCNSVPEEWGRSMFDMKYE